MGRIIEKSLIWYKFEEYSNLNINDIRLLLSYMATINPRESSKTGISFKLDWLCNRVFCLTTESKRNILKSVDYWNNAVFTDSNTKMKRKVFEYVTYTADEQGNEIIQMKCDDNFIEYFFHIKKQGYIKYSIDNVYNLLTVNQLTIYEILCMLARTHQNEIAISKIVKWLNLNEKYLDYNYFNKNLLRNIIKKINSCTDLHVDYAPKSTKYKRNKRVTHITFDIQAQELIKSQLKRKGIYKHVITPQKQLIVHDDDYNYMEFAPTHKPYNLPYRPKYNVFSAYGTARQDSYRYKKVQELINIIESLNEYKYKIQCNMKMDIPNALKEVLTANNLLPEISSLQYFSNSDLDYWIMAFTIFKNSKNNVKLINTFISEFKFKGCNDYVFTEDNTDETNEINNSFDDNVVVPESEIDTAINKTDVPPTETTPTETTVKSYHEYEESNYDIPNDISDYDFYDKGYTPEMIDALNESAETDDIFKYFDNI